MKALMRGKDLYRMFIAENAKDDCGVESWMGLTLKERGVWDRIAERVIPVEHAAEMELVIEDFMPNVGVCALQDMGRLNEVLMYGERHPGMRRLRANRNLIGK
jgi:hypothetical protein